MNGSLRLPLLVLFVLGLVAPFLLYPIFLMKVLCFALFACAYNLLIGYLLTHREDTGAGALLLFFLAMSFHFVTTDHGLREDHVQPYDRYGRWVLVASVVTGWVLGLLVTVPPMAVALLFAFLAGGVILNVLKEELPEERQSRFASFAGGAVFYSALVIGERLV